MTAPTPPTGDALPYEALEALAAGELSPAQARALEARIAAEPAVAAAWHEVQAVEAALRAESLLPTPLGLEARIGRAVLGADRSAVERGAWRVLARVAAAVLVVVGSWFAFSDETSALADVRETPRLLERARDFVPPADLHDALAERAAPAVDVAGRYAPAMLLVVIGVVLLVGGLALLLHLHRRAARGAPA